MGFSSHFSIDGKASGTSVAAFTSSYPDFAVPIVPPTPNSYIVIPMNTDATNTYRGAEIEFFANIASTAFAANEVWIGFDLAGAEYLRVRKYGTIGVTSSATALTNLATQSGFTGSVYPCDTISTAWAITGYATSVEAISGIASTAIAPSSNDMANAIIQIPYLDGATHLVFRCPNVSTANQLSVAVRKISKDK